jgi:endogenous inhibitor of DNA gyrase (YacG/DUF329 family)
MKPADKAPGGGQGRRRPGGKGRRCPICGKAAVQNYRPFCSKRCADIDLGRWLRGAYAVPDDAAEDMVGDGAGGESGEGGAD